MLKLFFVLYRCKNAVFEITSKDVGTFEVTGKFFGVSMEKVELVFQVIVAVGVQSDPTYI